MHLPLPFLHSPSLDIASLLVNNYHVILSYKLLFLVLSRPELKFSMYEFLIVYHGFKDEKALARFQAQEITHFSSKYLKHSSQL